MKNNIKNILFLVFIISFLFNLNANEESKNMLIGNQYINAIKKISISKNANEATSLFASNVKKIVNSNVICDNREQLLKQMNHFLSTDTIKEVRLLELIEASHQKANVIWLEFFYDDGDVESVMTILKYNDQNEIEEINDVYGQKHAYSWQEK